MQRTTWNRYKAIPYAAFKQSAEYLADVTVGQMMKSQITDAKSGAKKQLRRPAKKNSGEKKMQDTKMPVQSKGEGIEVILNKLSLRDKPREPMLIQYPLKSRVAVLLELVGNVADSRSNFIELSNMQVRHWAMIPKERLVAARLLLGSGSTGASPRIEGWQVDADVASLDAEIQRRIATLSLRLCGEDCWELRNEIKLPMACEPKFRNKLGAELSTYMVF